MTIGERIQVRRKELDMTQTELAERMGYKDKTSVSKIESNINDIPQSKIVKFAEVLDCSVPYLMGWEETASQNTKEGNVSIDEPSSEAELMDYLDMLRNRPECRMFLDTIKGATKEEVEENVRFIEALRQAKNNAD